MVSEESMRGAVWLLLTLADQALILVRCLDLDLDLDLDLAPFKLPPIATEDQFSRHGHVNSGSDLQKVKGACAYHRKFARRTRVAAGIIVN